MFKTLGLILCSLVATTLAHADGDLLKTARQEAWNASETFTYSLNESFYNSRSIPLGYPSNSNGILAEYNLLSMTSYRIRSISIALRSEKNDGRSSVSATFESNGQGDIGLHLKGDQHIFNVDPSRTTQVVEFQVGRKNKNSNLSKLHFDIEVGHNDEVVIEYITVKLVPGDCSGGVEHGQKHKEPGEWSSIKHVSCGAFVPGDEIDRNGWSLNWGTYWAGNIKYQERTIERSICYFGKLYPTRTVRKTKLRGGHCRYLNPNRTGGGDPGNGCQDNPACRTGRRPAIGRI
jgi:hypothetical protein